MKKPYKVYRKEGGGTIKLFKLANGDYRFVTYRGGKKQEEHTFSKEVARVFLKGMKSSSYRLHMGVSKTDDD